MNSCESEKNHLCRSGREIMASKYKGLGSILGQSLWTLIMTKVALNWILPEVFHFFPTINHSTIAQYSCTDWHHQKLVQ
jgi:hypothetical protein